jgi:hypothetical protein
VDNPRSHAIDHQWQVHHKQVHNRPIPCWSTRRNAHAHCRQDDHTPMPGRPPCHRGRRWGHPNRFGSNQIFEAKLAATTVTSANSTLRPTMMSPSTRNSDASVHHHVAAPHASMIRPLNTNRPCHHHQAGGGERASPLLTLTRLHPPARLDDSEESEREEGMQGLAARIFSQPLVRVTREGCPVMLFLSQNIKLQLLLDTTQRYMPQKDCI